MYDLNQIAVEKIAQYRAVYETYSGNVRDDLAVLKNADREYRESGIAYCSVSVGHALDHFGMGTGREFFKPIADALDRPFVYAEHDEWGHIVLSVPRNRKMENVVAGLLVLAQNDDVFTNTHRYKRRQAPVGVLKNESPQRWKFYFKGSEAEERFNEFLEMCRTDRVARIILKL